MTSPTLAVIGEAGPEAVIPLSRGRGAMGGMGATIIIEGNSFYGDDDQFMERLGDKLMKMMEPHLSYGS